MQKQFLFIASLLLTSSLLACKKQEQAAPAPPPTATQLLTDKKWQVQSSVITAPGQPAVDVYALAPAYKQDDFEEFQLPATVLYDEGPTKYSPATPQTQSGTWLLGMNDTQLTITLNGRVTTYLLDELTATSLKTRYVQSQANGTTATTVTAFKVIP